MRGARLASWVAVVSLWGCEIVSAIDDLHPARGDASAADVGNAAPGLGDASDSASIVDAGGAGDAPQGRPGIDAVVGGRIMRSSGHVLVLSVGESPGGNGVARSSKHRLAGGLVGTTQR
jgi:hypothetical protein